MPDRLDHDAFHPGTDRPLAERFGHKVCRIDTTLAFPGLIAHLPGSFPGPRETALAEAGIEDV